MLFCGRLFFSIFFHSQENHRVQFLHVLFLYFSENVIISKLSELFGRRFLFPLRRSQAHVPVLTRLLSKLIGCSLWPSRRERKLKQLEARHQAEAFPKILSVSQFFASFFRTVGGSFR